MSAAGHVDYANTVTKSSKTECLWIGSLFTPDAVIIAPKWQHAALSSCLRSRRSVAIKESSLLPGEQPSTAIPQGIKVDLQEIDETIRYSDSACIRAWAQKNPYKVSRPFYLPGDCITMSIYAVLGIRSILNHHDLALPIVFWSALAHRTQTSSSSHLNFCQHSQTG